MSYNINFIYIAPLLCKKKKENIKILIEIRIIYIKIFGFLQWEYMVSKYLLEIHPSKEQ